MNGYTEPTGAEGALLKLNMSVPILKLPTLSAADEELVKNAYIQTTNEDKMMQKLEKEMNAPESMEVESSTSNRTSELQSPIDLKTEMYSFLRANGVIASQLGAPEEYLDTDIHPIFRSDNFKSELGGDWAMKAWDAMAPALTLATKWISTPNIHHFWHLLAFGELVSVDEKPFMSGTSIPDDPLMASAAFANVLTTMAHKVKFWWMPNKCPTNRWDGCATSNMFDLIPLLDKSLGAEVSMRSGYSESRSGDYMYEYSGHIGLHCRFLYSLLSPESRAHSDKCTMMRLQAEIAVVLCHELCHAIYQWRGIPHKEPYTSLSDGMAELGFSWTQNVFGAEPFLGQKHGMQFFYCRTYKYLYSYPTLAYIIKDRWVEAWFRRDTWTLIKQGHDQMKLPAAASIPGPTLWMIDRFVPDGQGGGHFRKVIYSDREVVWPEDAKQKEDALPEGVMPEEWYAEVRKRDIELAIVAGIDQSVFQEAHGDYTQDDL